MGKEPVAQELNKKMYDGVGGSMCPGVHLFVLPFQFFDGEAGEKSVLRLLKLYNLYSSIKKYEALVKENLEKLSVYNKSIKHHPSKH